METSESRLPFFPELYPGEQIYHAIGRYQYLSSPELSTTAVKKLLFRNQAESLNFYLMDRLGILCNRLGRQLSLENVLMEHTAYPYVSCFLPKKRQDYFLDSCFGFLKAPALIRSTTFDSKLTDTIYICPVCAKEDLEQFGETYIHVQNNLPGIKVCPKHKNYLNPYPLDPQENPHKHFITLDAKRINFNIKDCQDPNELALALLAQELFSFELNQYNLENIIVALKEHLKKAGYILNKRFNAKSYQDFLSNLEKFYSSQFLEEHNFFDENGGISWFFRTQYRDLLISPVNWFILIHFFSDSIKDFLELTPFPKLEDGPWPCINPVCPHHGEKIIEDYQVAANRSSLYLECPECHMVYTKIFFPDGAAVNEILKYGTAWFEELHKLKNQDKSFEEIALLLEITPLEVSVLLRQHEL